ncbi:MAG TPA: peptidase [Nitrosopumilaceae archaeon]|nr:peptidase [Nitrosopumilaceae archaeon]
MIFIPIFSGFQADAAHNPNLYVSAENSDFENHFAGSMVIEVVVTDPNYSDVGNAMGEPDVTLNGKDLRMVQATDGKWYAYFASIKAAKNADQLVLNAGPGAIGKSLDFGVFCSSTTSSSVLGVSFSDTEGVSVPGRIGLSDFTNGNSAFTSCTSSPTGGNENNVVRNPRSINTNPSVSPGQIGIDIDAWPIIQLFSFSNSVEIKFNRAGGVEKTVLSYDDIPNISLSTDRNGYPNNAEVFLTINDIQLNQDPTDEDSWTFNINSPETAFYQAFTESGSDSGNNSPGLINLVPHLSSLGFEDNGKLAINLGTIARLKTNDQQPSLSVSDTMNTFTQIVTVVESEPNSGKFENFDSSNESTIGILGNAPRGQSAIIQYDDKSTSILAGPSTASISMTPKGGQFNAGQQAPVTVVDTDQNFNSGSRDILNVFRSTAIIPTLQLGEPATLEKTSGLKFYTVSTDTLSGGFSVDFSVPDKNSDRLIINTAPVGTSAFEVISMNMGITAGTLQSLFINNILPNNIGTNWLNFDLKSIEQQLGVSSFSDTSISLHFGGLPGTAVQILDPGDISSGSGLIQLDDVDIVAINSVPSSSSVFLVVNFDSSDNTVSTGMISNEKDSQPIVVDFFSFGQKNNQDINNAIYRFELEETANDSGIFVGSIEYSVTNQVNISDPSLIKSLRTIDDRIKFLVNNRLIDEKGINIAYSDISGVGVIISTSSKTDINTNSGTVSFTSNTYRFGQPVFFVLKDPDLNLKHDTIESYQVVNNPNSPNVDTVGTSNGEILVEILIKDFRYKRCTINGLEHGGLASTGFILVETAPNSGIFEGSFKMPSQICDKTGTKLISTAGGSLDAKYYDFRDSSGKQNIFSSTSLGSSSMGESPTSLNFKKFIIPEYRKTTDVILSGKVNNYNQGTTIDITLFGPDLSSEKFTAFATKNGEFRGVFTLHDYSLPGNYKLSVSYQGIHIGDEEFQVSKYLVPDWIKNNARWWSSDQISDSEFIRGIQHLIDKKIIVIQNSVKSQNAVGDVPIWIKNTAKWWSQDIVSDDEFVAAIEFFVKNGIIRL